MKHIYSKYDIKELQERIRDLTDQRNELLEACKAGFAALEAYYGGRLDNHKCASWFEMRDAIAKAEGKE